jgi:GxxExxY protein
MVFPCRRAGKHYYLFFLSNFPDCLLSYPSLKYRMTTPAREKEMTENDIGTEVIGAAIAVHRHLGPGLLETVYEAALAHELGLRGLAVARQVPVPIRYKAVTFEEGFRADIIVEGKVLLELKSVEAISPNHMKQVQTYLKLTGCKLGYLLNFNSALMKNGITRFVNGLIEKPKSNNN